MKGFSSKRIAPKVDVLHGTGTYTVFVSPEILQAGAVKGLTSTETTSLIRDGEIQGERREVGEEGHYTPVTTLLPPK